PNLPLVINHDLPMVAEDYVHRIGRTGRAGATGEALSLVSPEEGALLNQIQKMLKAEIRMDVVAGYEPSRPIRLDAPMPPQGGRGQRPGGGQRRGAPKTAGDQRAGEQRPRRAPGKPGHRQGGHGKAQPAAAHAHAGPKAPGGRGRGGRGRGGSRGGSSA